MRPDSRAVIQLPRVGRNACALVGGLLLQVVLNPESLCGQELVLESSVEKAVFFEFEPVFLLMQFTNRGPDTVWIGPFEVETGDVQVEIKRDGQLVPASVLIADLMTPRGWRGFPVPPGESVFESITLQCCWGGNPAASNHLFRRHLLPGRYEVQARFHYDRRTGSAQPSVAISDPARFMIRDPLPEETRVIKEVKAIRALPWRPNTRSLYIPALLNWVEREAAIDSTSLFIPFLLDWGLRTAYAVGIAPDRQMLARASSLRLRVMKQNRDLPAGVRMAEVLALEEPSLLDRIDASVQRSVAGRAAKYHASQLRHRN